MVRRAGKKKEHEDPAIAAFLDLLALDIRKGKRIRVLPQKLAETMLQSLRAKPFDLDEPIKGQVTL